MGKKDAGKDKSPVKPSKGKGRAQAKQSDEALSEMLRDVADENCRTGGSGSERKGDAFIIVMNFQATDFRDRTDCVEHSEEQVVGQSQEHGQAAQVRQFATASRQNPPRRDTWEILRSSVYSQAYAEFHSWDHFEVR